jgi:hypothetical protein
VATESRRGREDANRAELAGARQGRGGRGAGQDGVGHGRARAELWWEEDGEKKNDRWAFWDILEYSILQFLYRGSDRSPCASK